MSRAGKPGPSPAGGRTGLPRWVLAVAIGLPAILVVAVVTTAVALRSREPGALALAPLPAPQARSTSCDRLLAELPEALDGGEAGELTRRPVAAARPGTAAWGDPAVVLRCGLTRPVELSNSARLLEVSEVQFLELPGSTWVVVDRPVYVAVTLPDSAGSGPLQQLAATVRATLPRRDIDVGG